MPSHREIFNQAVLEWRRKLAGATTPDATALIFEHCADDVGRQVAWGLDTTIAADGLHELASAYGLLREFEETDIQAIISEAINRAGRLRIVANCGEPAVEINGHGVPFKIHSKADFVSGFKPPNYLIEGMLQRRFVYSMTGQTGHAKTAIALLIATLIGSRNPDAMLGSHKVEAGRVIYFVGENPDDLRMRVIGADSQRKDDPLRDDIFFIPGVFNIGELHNQIAREILRLGGIDLVIIDTSAAYFLGNEELSNTQMGAHARMLRRLTELPGGPCVLVLCHPIKYVTEAAQLQPRGGGAFLAEMDGNLTAAKKDDRLIELHHNKIRGPGFEPMTFELETVKTDKLADSKGRPIPTVRAVAISDKDENQRVDRSRDDEDKLLAVRLKMGETRLSIADLARECQWTFADGSVAKSRAQKVIERLEKDKLLRKDRGQYLLTDKGKEIARKAALRLEALEIARSEAANQMAMELC